MSLHFTMFSRKLGSAQQRPSFWTCKPHHKLLNLEAMEWKLCRKICLQNLSTLELVPGYWWILQDWTDFLVYDTWSNCSSLPTHLGRLKAAISKGFTVQALSLPPFRQASSHERVLQGLKKPQHILTMLAVRLSHIVSYFFNFCLFGHYIVVRCCEH